MTVKNAVYQVDNGSGFDEIHFKTKAAQVECNDGRTVEDKLKSINVKAYMTTAQSVANNSTSILYMNGVFFDDNGMFNLSQANRLTVKEDGIYDVKALVTFATNTAGRRVLRISRNGSGASNSIRQIAVSPVSGDGTSVFANTIHKLSVGDFLICEVLQDSGASLNVLNATFEMVKIG